MMRNTSAQDDGIADVYDTLFVDEKSIEENNAVAKKLAPYAEYSIFEIGCGTGLFLDLISITPDGYWGCDPSEKMLSFFKKKHPDFSSHVELGTFEQNKKWRYYSAVVSIFGAVSYVKVDSLRLLAESPCHKFLMFYKPDYTPVTYTKTNVHFFHYKYEKELLEKLFSNCNIEEFNNFLIIYTH